MWKGGGSLKPPQRLLKIHNFSSLRFSESLINYFCSVKATNEIQREISLGEDSSRQFKVKLNDTQQLAKEMCAMSNSEGGVIYVGVTDDGQVPGISSSDVHLYNQWISAAANEMIKPAVYPRTQTIDLDGNTVLLIELSNGVLKPYCDNKGHYWIKSGSDTRNASPQELARMFQESSQVTLDETPTKATLDTLDQQEFLKFFKRHFDEDLSSTGLSVEQVLTNMNLLEKGKLTLGGLLLFGKNVQNYRPFCLIRAVSYPGLKISDNVFNDKKDCIGAIHEQFKTARLFLRNNLRRVQTGQSFNEPGTLEIDEQALEEVLVNALLHRDYSKNAVIRLLVFQDRVEVISPGKLPNHLTVENIKSGNSVMRNPLLTSFGTKLLPYSGIGSGIIRIVKSHPDTEFINDVEGEQFIVKMWRKQNP